MTRIFWAVSVTALCAAIGCEGLDQGVADDRAPGAGQGDDPGPLDPEGSSCTADSLDAAGCACDAGAPPRQCWIAAAEATGNAECAYGTQTCESSGNAEVDAAAVWGPCLPTAAGTEDGACGDVPDPGCTDTAGCDNPEACCDARLAECSEAGETSAVCDLLDDVCRTTTCTEVFQVCDPTMLPVSPLCARMAYTCFGFRVNKCRRESFDSCVASVGDVALCTAWDEACSDREDYCAELLGSDTAEPSNGDEEKDGGQYSYECTDWGHIFDPCWASYVACGQVDPACTATLQTCLSAHGDIYEPICEGPADDGDPGKDHPTDDPGGGEGGGSGDGDAPDPG